MKREWIKAARKAPARPVTLTDDQNHEDLGALPEPRPSSEIRRQLRATAGGRTGHDARMTLAEVWPVRRLRVTTSVLELAVPGEDELAELAMHAAAGIYDPQSRFLARSPVAGWESGPSPQAEWSFLRYYWASLADWRPSRWNLVMAVKVDGACVGVQEIGAQDFGITRTVSTGSWIARRFQRRGYGKQMRAAILHLAFAGLGADRAESAAWSTNAPSLGVSWSLGYQSNGTTIRAFDGARQEQINLVLDRQRWESGRDDIAIHGLGDEVLELMDVSAASR
ncbi:GNAT family N-acetyltransferase [Micromonospora sp. WMMA1996]|nr:GNAT family N-acetyltransferase [Micromonospora sp. WMMA1996]